MLGKNVVEFSVDGVRMIGNTYNGSIIGLSDKGVKLLDNIRYGKSIKKDNLDKEELLLYDTLIAQGYFENQDEKLKIAYFHVNNDCNLHCLGCYSHDSSRNSRNNLSFEECCLIVDKLSLMGAKGIVISGGEPFLRNDIFELFKYIKEKSNIDSIQVITNGTQNYKDLIFIKQYVDEVNISIDGYSEIQPSFIRDKGIYEKVMSSVELFRDNNINVKMLATIHRKNIESLEEYMKLSQKMQVPIGFSLLTVAGDYPDFEKWLATEEQLSRLGAGEIAQLKKVTESLKPEDFIFTCRKSCGVGQSVISIGSDGTVYPCHMLHDSKLILGNILTDSTEFIQKECSAFADKVDVKNLSKCKECQYKYMCGGGCRTALFNEKGVYSESGECELSQAYFKRIMDSIKKSILN